MSALYIRLTANSTSGGSTTWRSRNNNANGNQTFTVSAAATGEFQDTTHSDTIVAGDRVGVQDVPPATGTFTINVLSYLFAATTDTVTRLVAQTGVNQTTTNSTQYYQIGGNSNQANVSESTAEIRMRKAGTMKNAAIYVSSAMTSATTLRLRKNVANGNSVVTCTASTTGWFEDTTNSDSIAAGDDLCWAITTGAGTGTFTSQQISADFVSTNGDGIVIIGTNGSAVSYSDNTTGYLPLGGNLFAGETTETDTKMDAREAFTFSELTTEIFSNSIAATSSITLRKNGANTTLTLSIGSTATGIFTDSTHTETVTTTDEVNWVVVAANDAAGVRIMTFRYLIVYTHINVNQNITKSLATETVSVSESAARQLGKTRTKTETVSISEAVAKLKTLIRKAGGQSIKFDGIDDRINCGNQASLWSSAKTKFSFTIWVYPTAGADGFTRYIVLTNTNAAHGFGVYLHSTVANRVNFIIVNAAVVDVIATSNGDIVMNAWNHLACVYDSTLGSQNLKIYVNKVMDGSASLTETISQSNSLVISNNSDDFKGNTKDFRWYTTRALTQAEIDLIFANDPAAPTPDYWLKMEEGVGDPKDAISGTLVGTLQNGASWDPKAPPIWAFETVPNTETLVKSKGRPRAPAAETVTVGGGSISRQLGKIRALIETVTSGEAVARRKTMQRSLPAETVTVSGGTLARMLGKIRAISQTVSIGETVARALGKQRAPAVETVTQSGTVIRSMGKVRSISQTVAIAEQVLRQLGKKRSPAAETVTQSGTVSRQVGRSRAISQTVSIGEAVTRALGKVRSIVQTVVSGESVTRSTGKNRTISQSVTISELVNRVKGAIRSIIQTVVISESVDKSRGANKTLNEDTGVSESVTRQKGTSRALPESTPITEDVQRRKGLSRAINQTVSIGEALARMLGKARSIIESIVITEDLQKARGTSKDLEENTNVGESVTRQKGATRSINQSTPISENVTRSLQKVRSIIQTVIINEVVARMKGLSRALAPETVAISESASQNKGVNRTLPEDTDVNEDVSRTLGKSRSLNENVPSSEDVTRIKGLHRTLIENVSSSELLQRVKGLIRSIIENITVTEDLQSEKSGERARSLTENTGVTDSLARSKGSSRPLEENTAINENVTKSKGVNRSITQNVIIGELIARAKSVNRTIAQTVSIIGNVTRSKAANRTITQTTDINESLDKQRGKMRSVSDTVTITDLVDRAMVKARSIIQNVAISESVTKLKSNEIKHIAKSLTENVVITEAVERMKGVNRHIGEVVGSLVDYNRKDHPALEGLICDLLKQQWVAVNPSQNEINWKSWYTGIDDISIDCGPVIMIPKPTNLPWDLFDYDSYVMVNVFVTDIKGTDGEPQISNIRRQIENTINGNPNALAANGIDMIKIDSIIPKQDYDDDYKNDIFRLIVRVNLKHIKKYP